MDNATGRKKEGSPIISIIFGIVLFMVLCVCGGCSSSSNAPNNIDYEDKYSDGYDDGYEDGYKDTKADEYLDDLRSFQTAIAELMYDHKYDEVKKIYDYYPDGVEAALEYEFGVKDIAAVIEYLEELSQTVTGNCEICGDPVYADDITFLPDGIKCAHSKCISGSDDTNSLHIKESH